ncbi:membrane protein [Listeria monocytogenes]|nr:membrane protein [Listeria monocytogenes]
MEQNKEKLTKPTSEKNYFWPIMIISFVAVVVILLLFFSPIGYQGAVHFDITIFPRMNAIFNSFTFVFLVIALWAIIKKKNIKMHRGFILAAFTSTLFFLVTYLTFHYLSAETSTFGGTGIIRPIYFFILITHSFLAAIVVPLALFALVWGWTMQIEKHKKTRSLDDADLAICQLNWRTRLLIYGTVLLNKKASNERLFFMF